MNLAVVLEGNLYGGGGYQQQLSTILELKKINKYDVFVFVFSEENKKVLESYDIKVINVGERFTDKVFRYFNQQELFYLFFSRYKFKSSFEKCLDVNDIDLVYFLAPSNLSLDLLAHNFIITDWDLSHRDTPEFPESSQFREFELRERLYTRSLKKAVAVLVDSKLGKQNVVRRYGVDEGRVFVASFVPSVNAESNIRVDVKEKYQIDGEYIYYPAQFWAHKNHTYIIDALAQLKSEGKKITAIFSGSNKGNLKHVLEYAKHCNVSELVNYIGFAPNEEIYSLYKNSIAMVMPSYFGPTNIPPLEAFAIGTPVIYSDLDGLREQVGDAALLCDLKDPKSLAEHLKKLLASNELRQLLIQKGTVRLAELKKSSVLSALVEIFDEYAIKLKCWKMPKVK